MVHIKNNAIPQAHEAIALYLDAGWGEQQHYTGRESVFEKAFNASRFITAWDGERLVGMIRFLSDGAHDTQIIECLVLKAYRRQGIATKMLTLLKEDYGQTVLYIQTTPEGEACLMKNGFKKQHRLTGMSFVNRTLP